MADPATISMIIGSILGGAGAFGTSPGQKKTEQLIGTLGDAEEYLKSTPFSKEEIMNELLPEVQRVYRAASDVAAGRLGAAVGESGLPGGQGFAEYYTQTLAPVIARGEEQAAAATSEFGKWFSALDESAKNRFLQSIGMQMEATQGLPSMNQFQRVVSGALSGMNLGATAGGNVAQAQALNKQTEQIGEMTKLMQKQGSPFDQFDYMWDYDDKMTG